MEKEVAEARASSPESLEGFVLESRARGSDTQHIRTPGPEQSNFGPEQVLDIQMRLVQLKSILVSWSITGIFVLIVDVESIRRLLPHVPALRG